MRSKKWKHFCLVNETENTAAALLEKAFLGPQLLSVPKTEDKLKLDNKSNDERCGLYSDGIKKMAIDTPLVVGLDFSTKKTRIRQNAVVVSDSYMYYHSFSAISQKTLDTFKTDHADVHWIVITVQGTRKQWPMLVIPLHIEPYSVSYSGIRRPRANGSSSL